MRIRGFSHDRGGEGSPGYIPAVLRRLLPFAALVLVAVTVGAGVAWFVHRDDGTVIVRVTTTPTTVVDDRAERDDLLEYVQRSAAATWYVTGEFRRVIGEGDGITGDAFQINRPPDRLVGGGGLVTGVVGGETVSCSVVSTGYTCAKRRPVTPEEARDPAAYLAEVTSDPLHWYTVSRLPDTSVAGARGRCFRLTHRDGQPDPLGRRREYCYTAGGVPLRQLQEQGATITELTTTAFTTTVTDEDIERKATGTPPVVTTTTEPPTTTGGSKSTTTPGAAK